MVEFNLNGDTGRHGLIKFCLPEITGISEHLYSSREARGAGFGMLTDASTLTF